MKEFEYGCGAIFSPCRTWRYALQRVWDPDKKCAAFIGLNPSTADEIDDDNTVRRCIRFSKDWGYGGLWMLNLFAYRSTDPRALRTIADPIGPKNDQYIREITEHAGITVGAWGNHGSLLGRATWARYSIPNLHCLGVNKSGEPKHPLYLSSKLLPERLSKKG